MVVPTSARSVTARSPPPLLQHWGRDRHGEKIELEFLIKRQCADTASVVGLNDRGVIAPGYRADLNVIDFDRLCVRQPELRYDLPAGGRRIVQRADGYRHTFVAGVETYCDGEATGDLPGRLVPRPSARPDEHWSLIMAATMTPRLCGATRALCRVACC